MERTLKERLIGAAVLVAVAIILIPEMLSGPSTPTGNPLSIHSGDAHTSGKVSNSSAVLSGSNTATPVALPAGTDAASSQAGDGVSNRIGNQVGSQGETKSFTIDLRKSDPQLQEPVSNQTGAVSEQNKHVDQFPAAVAETKTEGQKVEGQGAQSRQDTSAVKQELGKPKQAEPANTASIEKPLSDKPVEKAVGTSTTSAGWAVQLGSFGTRAPADQMVIELKKEGYEAFVMPFESKGKSMFRVRIGPFRDRSSAEAMQEKVKRAYPSAAITPHP